MTGVPTSRTKPCIRSNIDALWCITHLADFWSPLRLCEAAWVFENEDRANLLHVSRSEWAEAAESDAP